MEWTVRYFMHKSRFWESATLGQILPGAAGYAHRKAAMWHQMAMLADRSFKINLDYKSPLN